jgi:cobalt-zinc-cadmium efflux system outer membrane protein
MRMTLILPALLMVAGYCVPSHASSLTLPQALQRTLHHDVSLQAYPYQLRMAEARQLQANITPNPELDVSLENVLGTGESRGLQGAELTLSLSQHVELGQKRERRTALAQQQSQLQRDNYELARLDALATTTAHYLQLLQLQELQTWASNKVNREHALLAMAQRRSQAGNLLDADISRIKLRLIRSQLELADIDQNIQSQQYRLAARWNDVPDFMTVTGKLAYLPPLPALSELQAQLQKSAALQRYITLQRISNSQLRLTEANSKADIQLSAGLKRNQASNDTAMVFGFSMPLTLTDPNQGLRQAQLAEQALQIRQQHIAGKELSLLLQQQWLGLQQLLHTIDAISNLLLPEAQQLQQSSYRSYQQGQLDLLSLLSSEEELAQAERELILSQSRFHFILVELERLTGQPMTFTNAASGAALEKNNE